MRRNGRLLIVGGVALALVAIVLFVLLLSGGSKKKDSTANSSSSSPQQVTVVEAKKDIPAHTLLNQDDLDELKIDSDVASPDAVHSVGEVIGFAYSADLQKGQRLNRSNLEEPGLANELDTGKRAISLPVDKNNLIGGLLREDDHIDIIYSIRLTMTRVLPTDPFEMAPNSDSLTTDTTLVPYGQDPGVTYPYPGEPGSRFLVSDIEDGEPVTKVVLQDIKVLRVVNSDGGGSTASSGSSTGDYIVLEVDPQQVELIQMMLTTGKYQISLRNTNDTAQVTTDGMNFKDLILKMGFPIPSTVRLPGPGAQ